MSSRRYLKRVWRVPKPASDLPKDFVNPAVRLGYLVLKLMRKHGWPAVLVADDGWSEFGGFGIEHDKFGRVLPPDFAQALATAVRIVARGQRVVVDHHKSRVKLARLYHVNAAGVFKEIEPLRVFSHQQIGDEYALSGQSKVSCPRCHPALCGCAHGLGEGA